MSSIHHEIWTKWLLQCISMVKGDILTSEGFLIDYIHAVHKWIEWNALQCPDWRWQLWWTCRSLERFEFRCAKLGGFRSDCRNNHWSFRSINADFNLTISEAVYNNILLKLTPTLSARSQLQLLAAHALVYLENLFTVNKLSTCGCAFRIPGVIIITKASDGDMIFGADCSLAVFPSNPIPICDCCASLIKLLLLRVPNKLSLPHTMCGSSEPSYIRRSLI